jgi:hypothetical protein
MSRALTGLRMQWLGWKASECPSPRPETVFLLGGRTVRPNTYQAPGCQLEIKRIQLTKLRAAPERRAEVPPCAPAGGIDVGTASQLIRSVRRTGRRWDRGEGYAR